jgi:hypothetical protein
MLVPRRAESETGVIGDALVDIGPDDPEWNAWREYYRQHQDEDISKVFCPTGEGGGIDPTCSPGESGKVPAEPGTVPIPSGHIRLFHQTTEESAKAIESTGIKQEKAQGIEGPKGIYADPKGFYGDPAERPTVEFHVSKDRWQPPMVTGDVTKKDIIAVHHPWHARVRYMEANPEVLKEVLAGEHDSLLTDKQYGPAIRYIKQRHR